MSGLKGKSSRCLEIRSTIPNLRASVLHPRLLFQKGPERSGTSGKRLPVRKCRISVPWKGTPQMTLRMTKIPHPRMQFKENLHSKQQPMAKRLVEYKEVLRHWPSSRNGSVREFPGCTLMTTSLLENAEKPATSNPDPIPFIPYPRSSSREYPLCEHLGARTSVCRSWSVRSHDVPFVYI